VDRRPAGGEIQPPEGRSAERGQEHPTGDNMLNPIKPIAS